MMDRLRAARAHAAPRLDGRMTAAALIRRGPCRDDRDPSSHLLLGYTYGVVPARRWS